MASLFQTKITTLKGIGEEKAKLFEKIGADSVGELLRCYPRYYEDWSNVVSVKEAPLDEKCAIRAMVVQTPSEHRIRRGMTLYKTTAMDDDGTRLYLTFFNNPYIPLMLKDGETYVLFGTVHGSEHRREMTSPHFSKAEGCTPMVPVYRQTEGLQSRQISAAVKQALDMLPEQINDPVPTEIRAKYNLCTLRYALEKIHFPDSVEEMEIARKRLIFEELLILQLGLLSLNNRTKSEVSSYKVKDSSEDFWQTLPFKPTGAQKRTVSEACRDMQGQSPMNRLVQGDVGSGKTAVAAALCYCTFNSRYQSAMMAPTEILAVQHFKSLTKMLSPLGANVALLTGSTKASEKRTLLSHLKTGRIDVLVGTHAIISEGVEFKNLALVITDEQHRFGVEQRAALASKGHNVHKLVMSATPIPRTLALMIYGDLDISVLDEMPPGRQPIETYAITSDKRKRAFNYIKKHIAEGHQAYIICPLVEEGESDMAAVTEYTKAIKKSFEGIKIAAVHGKMKPKEKEKIMKEFADNEIKILVSTTVVEVGVDVPNAVIMLIENAERYGLSQLHQLRGRVGRGDVRSTCILVSDAQNDEAKARLKIMCSTSDGFKIADEDLRLRGPGDFFGTNQHGLPKMKIANMIDDMQTLKQAQAEAKEILRADSGLKEHDHRALRAEVIRLFNRVGENGLN